MKPMKYLSIATVATAVLALAMPVYAQGYMSTTTAGPMDSQSAQFSAMWPNGSGSATDFPTYGPGDFGAADQLNRQVLMNNSTVFVPVR